jgi:hypothetical protein
MENQEKDVKYRNFDIIYLPHPKLKGKYQLGYDDKYYARYETLQEAKDDIDCYLKSLEDLSWGNIL